MNPIVCNGDRVFATLSYTLTPGAHIEILSTTNPSSTAPINLTGNELDNLIYGNAGSNTLNGGDGNDTLVSQGGNDILNGGIGNDTLNGGSGDDQLNGNDSFYGAAGANTLTGGIGNDFYYVDSASDTIVEAFGQGNGDPVFARYEPTPPGSLTKRACGTRGPCCRGDQKTR